jgi:hypothetical protein
MEAFENMDEPCLPTYILSSRNDECGMGMGMGMVL